MRYLQLGILPLVLFFAACQSNGQESAPTPSSTDCDQTAWLTSRAPGTYLTPEIKATLRDTVISVRGTPRRFSLPAGFTIDVFANIDKARGLAISPDGVLFVTSYSGGKIYALPDHDNNGVPDSVITAAQLSGSPHGMLFRNGTLMISNDGGLYQYHDANGDRRYESSEKLTTFPTGGHVTRNLALDKTGEHLYVQIGSSGNDNIEANWDSVRATISEVMPNGALRIVARGLRNAVGMDFDPRTNALWVNNNGIDNVFGMGDPRHNDIPPEAIYIICDGAHYGWPYAYGYQMRNPNYPNIDTGFIRSLSGPVAEVLAHSAPLGLHFYRGNQFPSAYRNAIFQTYHGSWNRDSAAPPRVTVMRADADGQNAQVQDFITGFQTNGTGARWGRVVSVIEGTHGELFISDDVAGAVYRVRFTARASVDLAPRQKAEVYPNPTSGTIHLAQAGGTFALRDLIGKRVYSGKVQGGTAVIPRWVTNGRYLLQVGNTMTSILLIR